MAEPLPKDPTPSWQGYSSATWSGDTLVIDTIGLRDDTWIDWNGSVLTEAAKVREEIRRPDFGHLEIKVTVDDPKAYTKPWTVTLRQRIVVDAELIDEICLENEKFEKFVDNLRAPAAVSQRVIQDPHQEQHERHVDDELQHRVADDVPRLQSEDADQRQHPERMNQIRQRLGGVVGLHHPAQMHLQ